MGYDRHHAIIVTSKDAEMLKAALDKADALGMTTTGIVPSPVNGWASFFVAPDGSKEGWDASDDGDAQRNNLVTWLDCQRWEDDSTRMDWVEVQYGDDELDTRIVSDSDQRRRDRRARDEAARRANPADRTILNLRAQEWFTIAGRGRIAVIDTAQIPGPPITVGDHVRIDNVHYEVLGIESGWKLTSPPQPFQHAGLLVRRIPYQCGTCGVRYATVGEHRCEPAPGPTCDVLVADSCGLCGATFMPGDHACG